jgi:hypothetical protein
MLGLFQQTVAALYERRQTLDAELNFLAIILWTHRQLDFADLFVVQFTILSSFSGTSQAACTFGGHLHEWPELTAVPVGAADSAAGLWYGLSLLGKSSTRYD